MSGDARLILPLFGNGMTLVEVADKLPPSARAGCDATIKGLLSAGYIAQRADVRSPVGHVDNAVAVMVGRRAEPAPQAPDQAEPCLDFTRKSPAFHEVTTGADALPNQFGSPEAMREEIESRSQRLASERISQYEQEMSNSLAQMAGYELLQAEQEKLARQNKMVETARLSPVYETLRGLEFFRDFSETDMAEVLKIGVWSEREEHEFLLHEDDQAESFYVLISGMAGLFKRDRLIGLVQGGESFGEFSLRKDEEATHHADVISRSHVEFMGFSHERLGQTSLEVRLQFAAAFSRCQTRRLVCANEQIVNFLADEHKRD